MIALAAMQTLLFSGALVENAATLNDKTLIVWASLTTLDQRGGTALTIDNGDKTFDGIVFGELEPKRWMPGSNTFSRTHKDQAAWPAESAGPDAFVQIAIVYRGQEIEVYRDGVLYTKYEMATSPQPFGPQSVVLFGRRHLEATDKENSFTGRIKDARIYSMALDAKVIAGMKPGQPVADLAPWAWWSFGDEGLREKTGRFNEIKLTGGATTKDGCLVLPGKGSTMIAASSANEAEDGRLVAPVPRTWSVDGAVPDEAVRSARLLREKFLADPHRPGYHFSVPEDMGMPGDPNGAFYQDGRYHLMYLYNRIGKGFTWGHISSKDLLHWRNHPDSIGPDAIGPDNIRPDKSDEGCFSGGAFVDSDGTVYLSYWMLFGAKGIGIARSSDPDYNIWTKSDANPVIKSTEWGVTEAKDATGKTIFYGSADPSNIWKKDGRYYMLTGSLLVLEKLGRKPEAPLEEQGDRLYLFVSDDLKTWKYLHVFYERKPEWTDRSEDNMCPSFLTLPSSPEGGPASNKHLLLFISHNKGCQYYIGDYRDDHFFPEKHGRMSWVDNTYFAPEALIDGKGRQIMWAWLTDNPPDDKQRGWSGVYGLPRSLWLGEDGTLRMAPVSELAALRDHEQTWGGLRLADGEKKVLDGITGDSCELQVEITCGTAKRCGVRVRASQDGQEETIIYYDTEKKELVFDSTRSGSPVRSAVERAPFALNEGERLTLRVFVDKPIVEVFANERQAIGRRVYPTRNDSLGVALFAEGGVATFDSVKAWRMMPTQPY